MVMGSFYTYWCRLGFFVYLMMLFWSYIPVIGHGGV